MRETEFIRDVDTAEEKLEQESIDMAITYSEVEWICLLEFSKELSEIIMLLLGLELLDNTPYR
jgi:hypothetical protein